MEAIIGGKLLGRRVVAIDGVVAGAGVIVARQSLYSILVAIEFVNLEAFFDHLPG